MKREERNERLVGWDAERVIQQAAKEIAESNKEGRRIADLQVDAEVVETPAQIGCLVFQEARGWRIESVGDLFPGQEGPVTVRCRDERHLVAEFRWALLQAMVAARFCREPEARKKAARAVITVHGRIPLGQEAPRA